MEVRGLGIVNITTLFGLKSIRHNKRLDLIVTLIPAKDQEELDKMCIRDRCCSPQNVTVIGMTGSGKSSTLDALAGERFCSLGRMISNLLPAKQTAKAKN